MKKFLGKLFRRLIKIFLILLYPVLIVLVIVLLVGFVTKNNELSNIYAQYKQVQDNLNKNDKENKITIDNLQQSFDDLNTEIKDLKTKNADLQKQANYLKDLKIGRISGKISGQIIISDNNISQYQFVCAQNTANPSSQYCMNVSALEQNYSMLVPEGNYNVFAKLLDKSNNTVSGNYKAIYSEKVKCLATSVDADKSKCTDDLSKKAVTVEVKAGESVSDVNPIDWQTQN